MGELPMNNLTMWMLAAGVLVALELATGTFYLLMIAIGAVGGAVAAAVGAPLAAQIAAAAVVGVLCVFAWHMKRVSGVKIDPEANPDINPDIGAVVQVDAWSDDGTAKVRYRGAEWDVELFNPEAQRTPGKHRVTRVRDSKLIVEKLD